MHTRENVFVLSFFSLSALFAAPPPPAAQVPLVVRAGVPLRLYLTRRVSKRAGQPVEAKLLEPVYAFDRQVIPAGALVEGRVARVQPCTRAQRTRAILNGDFTPLRSAPVEFTTLVMPDGRTLPLRTLPSLGLNSVAASRPSKSPPPAAHPNTGVLGTGKQRAEDAVHVQIERVKGIPDLVRGPGKKEKLEDYLMAKLPYHPQYVRRGTRFDATLLDPLDFGSAPVSPASLARLGAEPPADSVAHARLITPLDSAISKKGQDVEAVLDEPMFSPDRKLVLPEGTLLEGTVVAVRKARSFHRAGQLRFTFREIDLPPGFTALETSPGIPAAASAPVRNGRPAQEQLKIRTQADLQSAESTGQAALKVDGEGGVQAQESKTRFLAAAAAVMIARRAGDTDPERNQSHQVVGQSPNVAGRTIGGGFGFGLLGAAISQSSPYIGAAFGYYGMAWSLYSTLVARGAEAQFSQDDTVDIRFNARPDAAAAEHASRR